MALTNNGTKVTVADAQLPTGYTKPSVTTFSDFEWPRTYSFSITKSNVENATATTTMSNLINDATYGIDKLVEDEINADFDTTGNTVTIYSELFSLTTNYDSASGDGDWLTDTAAKYVCGVKTYVKLA